MTISGKPRQPRLRASCDGCFIAKVKCSKARPSCSRCLACGIECRYSPSSRIGKFKSEPEASLSRKMSMPEFHTIAPVVPSTTEMPRWQQGGHSLKRAMRRQASMMQLSSNGGGSRDFDFPWTPPNDMGSPFSDLSMASPPMTMDQHNAHHHHQHHQHQAILSSQMPMAMGINAPWMGPSPDVMGYLMNPAFVASTPAMGSTMTTPTSPMTPPQSACTCFQTCLQALNSLQRAVSPMFGNMTKLNAQAVEACAAMLNCAMCMSHPNRHTAIMSIAVIMTAATTHYRNAIIPPTTTGLGIVSGVGADQSQWMKIQILLSELDRLQKLYHHFNDACNKTTPQRPADGMVAAGLGPVMAGYIGQAISSTMEAVRQRSMDDGGATTAGLLFQ